MIEKFNKYFNEIYNELSKYCARYGANKGDVIHQVYLHLYNRLETNNEYLKTYDDFRFYVFKCCHNYFTKKVKHTSVIEYIDEYNHQYVESENYIYIEAENVDEKTKAYLLDLENNDKNYLTYLADKIIIDNILKQLTDEERLLYYYLFKMNFTVLYLHKYLQKNNMKIGKYKGRNNLAKMKKELLIKIKQLTLS